MLATLPYNPLIRSARLYGSILPGQKRGPHKRASGVNIKTVCCTVLLLLLFLSLIMNHHRVPQIGLVFSTFFPLSSQGERERESDTLFGEEGERETECNYSLRVSGAPLRTAAAAPDRVLIQQSRW